MVLRHDSRVPSDCFDYPKRFGLIDVCPAGNSSARCDTAGQSKAECLSHPIIVECYAWRVGLPLPKRHTGRRIAHSQTPCMSGLETQVGIQAHL